jgi:hypothetical protein
MQKKNPSEAVFYARPITLMEPHRIAAPAPWVGHIPFAFWIMEALRPSCFVELGTHSGNSFCAFLQGAVAAGLDATFFAVDHWKGDSQAGEYNDAIFADLRQHLDERYGERANTLRMTFDEALPRFADRSIDLLHIDGLHTYEAVRHDFDNWLPKLSPRGVVLFHDAAVYRDDFGVHRLMDELRARYPLFLFTHSYGLGVVQVGGEAELSLQHLMNGKPDFSGIDPRLYFERLGNALAAQFYLDALCTATTSAETIALELDQTRARSIELESRLSEHRHRIQDLVGGVMSQGGEEWGANEPQIILASGYLDTEQYRNAADLLDADLTALARHYLSKGEKAGLAPSPRFDPAYYAARNPDVVEAGLNLLLHFVTTGRNEGRLPVPPDPRPLPPSAA